MANISLAKEYDLDWQGEVVGIDAPNIPPLDPMPESYAAPRAQRHFIRIDCVPYDDEYVGIDGTLDGGHTNQPRGAHMAQGMLEPMDELRLVGDGSHA